MDVLFTRYAHPFCLMDGMISTGRFDEFIDTVLDQYNEDRMWDFYLAKIYDVSFEDFKESQKHKSKPANIPPSKQKLETTIHESMSIMKGLKPS